MKTKVEITATTMDYNSGETGYTDGYMMTDGRPCAVVVFENNRRIFPVPLKHLRPTGIFDNETIIAGEVVLGPKKCDCELMRLHCNPFGCPNKNNTP